MKRKSVEVAEREKNRAREGKGKDNSLNSKPSTNNVQESKLILQLQQRDKKEYQEANDIVISAKDRIMRVFNEALVRIDKRNREIDEQQADWIEQQNLTERKFEEKLEAMKNCCPELKLMKGKLLKQLKEIKRNKELVKKDNQNILTLKSLLLEQEKLFLEKVNRL